jgi:predicted dithiol-disulfide oxidoreductase (DUF899 family)
MPELSFIADSFDGSVVHLAARDTTLIAVSALRCRRFSLPAAHGLGFKWVSSNASDFNFDYQVRHER